MVYDICVVGAGLWGSSAARHASKPGRKVCLIGPSEPRHKDRPSRDIFASHYDAGRSVRKYQGSHHIRSLMTKRTMEGLKELEKETGIELSEVGHLMYGHNIGDVAVPMARAEGVLLSASGVRDRFPFLDTERYGDSALFFPRDAGLANPRLIVRAQLKAARLRGCDIIEDVVEAVREESGDRQGGEPLMHLETKSGRTVLAKKVLLCTGVFTELKQLLPRGVKLDLKIQGTFTVKLEVGDSDLKKLRGMPTMASFTDPQGDCYALPPIKYPDGKTFMKIGPGYYDQTDLHTLKEVKDWFLSEPDQKLVDKYKDILLSIVTEFSPLSIQTEMCASTRTPTTLPYCDMLSPRLGLAVGGNGFGAMLSDEVGRMAADMIAGTENWNRDIPREHLKARFVPPSSNL